MPRIRKPRKVVHAVDEDPIVADTPTAPPVSTLRQLHGAVTLWLDARTYARFQGGRGGHGQARGAL
jgi:hypothetical protein